MKKKKIEDIWGKKMIVNVEDREEEEKIGRKVIEKESEEILKVVEEKGNEEIMKRGENE